MGYRDIAEKKLKRKAHNTKLIGIIDSLKSKRNYFSGHNKIPLENSEIGLVYVVSMFERHSKSPFNILNENEPANKNYKIKTQEDIRYNFYELYQKLLMNDENFSLVEENYKNRLNEVVNYGYNSFHQDTIEYILYENHTNNNYFSKVGQAVELGSRNFSDEEEKVKRLNISEEYNCILNTLKTVLEVE